MSLVVAMRPYPQSHMESAQLKAPRTTAGVERRGCVTGFPVGFGGWTAAKMYEQRTASSSSLQQHTGHLTDNTAADAARQEVRTPVTQRCISHWMRGPRIAV